MTANPIVICGAKRTPIGSFQGQFQPLAAPALGAAAIRAALEHSAIEAEKVSEVLMGCVLPAGVGQAPARQASLAAGLPLAAGCTTVNKVCGSGMKAIMLGADLIAAGSAEVVVAGGMESMSNAPYLLPKARGGYRLGHGEIIDHLFYDGLQNPYDRLLMGQFGDRCAAHYQFSRAEQDAFAATSVRRAMAAMDGDFLHEITAVEVTVRGQTQRYDRDEEPPRCKLDKIPALKPAFASDGTVTAANASKISDGAAAVILAREIDAAHLRTTPLAVLVGHATHAQEPEWFTTAPIGAISRLMDKIGWTVDEVDLFEINEAFAVVTMAAIRDLKLDPEKVNVNGGACALGHPIGASGARLVVTLLNALARRGLKRGIAALCIGGGEATAVAIERL